MKVLQTISDDSKASLAEPVEVIIDRPGYMVGLEGDLHACPARFDLGVDELEKFMKRIIWSKKPDMRSLPSVEIPKV